MHGHSPMASFLPSPAAPEHLGTAGAHVQHGVGPARCVLDLLLPAPVARAHLQSPAPPHCPAHRLLAPPRPAPGLLAPPRPRPAPGPVLGILAPPRHQTPGSASGSAPTPPANSSPPPTPPLRLLSPLPPLLVQRGPLALVTGETREDISVVAGPGGRGRGGREPHVCGPGRRVGQSTAVRTHTVARGPPAPPSAWWPPGSGSGNPLLITASVSAPNKICRPPPSFADVRPQAHMSPAAVGRGGPALLTLHTRVLSKVYVMAYFSYFCALAGDVTDLNGPKAAAGQSGVRSSRKLGRD